MLYQKSPLSPTSIRFYRGILAPITRYQLVLEKTCLEFLENAEVFF
ncbi:hypothetical protein LEP1GSC061_3906 [Leptospira wolffii serovar Khorat str. Khorat-H2]|nr:hypothetical protein LEP1GSC061_3906 [Leptospira wolffii serovar Khorat str. Khorat-H2]